MKLDSIKVYTIQEVADILKLSRQTIYNYVNQNKIKATKIGKEYRIEKAALESFLQRGA